MGTVPNHVYISRENNAISIDNCIWSPKKRQLVSDIPILYRASPPPTILVIGRTRKVLFNFMSHLHSADFTLYNSDEVGINLLVPWDKTI